MCNDDKTVLDDSRKMGPGKPVELVLGKKFKMEVWEAIIQKMAVNEVAEFTVDKSVRIISDHFCYYFLFNTHGPKSSGNICYKEVSISNLKE